jgi:CrcB protein
MRRDRDEVPRVDYFWVGIGGCVGACARYALGTAVGRRFGTGFPYGTFVVNITGAFLIGVILTLLTERFVADPRWRLLLVVGVLGGYTTFSSFVYEAFVLADRGQWLRAGMYVIGSNIFGLSACVAGVLLTRRLAGG